MKHDFLITPHLNQAFESEGSSGGSWSNGITRRSFIKRTGGATVASLVAWNLTNQRTRADLPSSATSGSGSTDVIWKKYKTDKDIPIVGYGSTSEAATEDFYRNAESENISGTSNSTFTGEQREADVSGMKRSSPPFISSEHGTGAAPNPVLQSNGVWKCARTIAKGTKFLKWFYVSK